MKYTLIIKDENDKEHSYNIKRSSQNEPNNLNDFILKCLSISEDKRELPLLAQCPNGLEVYPSLKMKFENYGSPLLGDQIEAMIVTWKD
jgi:hypothetical protein